MNNAVRTMRVRAAGPARGGGGCRSHGTNKHISPPSCHASLQKVPWEADWRRSVYAPCRSAYDGRRSAYHRRRSAYHGKLKRPRRRGRGRTAGRAPAPHGCPPPWRLYCLPLPATLPPPRPPVYFFSPKPGRVAPPRRPRSAWPQGARILLDRLLDAADDARMTNADRLRLLFGPDRNPRFRYGGALSCEPRKLGPSPPGAGGLVGRRVATQSRIRAILAGQRLPAPHGQGYAAGAGHRGRSWLVGQSTPL